jgi:hypothetical protein
MAISVVCRCYSYYPLSRAPARIGVLLMLAGLELNSSVLLEMGLRVLVVVLLEFTDVRETCNLKSGTK